MTESPSENMQKKVWESFEIKNLCEYHGRYVQ